jgi:hypothetical protein
MITSSLLNYEYPHGPVWHAAVQEMARQAAHKYGHGLEPSHGALPKKNSSSNNNNNGSPLINKAIRAHKSMKRIGSSSSICEEHYAISMEERRGQQRIHTDNTMIMFDVGSLVGDVESDDEDYDGRGPANNLTNAESQYISSIREYIPVQSAVFHDYF